MGAHGRLESRTRRRRPLFAAGASVMVALAVSACYFTDPYGVTCGDIKTSPDRLREASYKLAGNDVQGKVRYEDELERICADAPDAVKPAQQVKPEE